MGSRRRDTVGCRRYFPALLVGVLSTLELSHLGNMYTEVFSYSRTSHRSSKVGHGRLAMVYQVETTRQSIYASP